MAEMIKIRSTTDTMISLYDASLPLHKVWSKRNAICTVERDKLVQVYFSSSLEDMLRSGVLVIEDKDFLYEVGFITEEEAEVDVIELTPTLMKRYIKLMPLAELEMEIKKLSPFQLNELATFAIENNNDLMMDRVSLLSKYCHKDILKAIELYRKNQED